VKRTASRSEHWLLPFAGVLCVLIVWEACVRGGVIRSVFLPAPSAVLAALVENLRYLLASAAVTLRDIAIGYVSGCTLGVGLGLAIGYWRRLDLALAPVLLLLSPIPIVTFLPLFIIWFGLNLIPVLCCAFIAALFPSLMSSISGVKNADRALVEAARNFGASNRQIVMKVVLPGALPEIANGLRLSIQLCFLVTPVAEMIMGDIGLGGLIWKSADLFKTELVLVGQLTLGTMGLILYKTFDYVETRHLLKWKRHANAS